MSHFTRLKTRLVEEEPLRLALADLGYACEAGAATIRGYGGQETRVDLRVPTRHAGYDLGFRKAAEAYELVADWWGISDLQPEAFLRQLTQRYAYHATRAKLEAQGFTVTGEEQAEDGRIHLTLRRVA